MSPLCLPSPARSIALAIGAIGVARGSATHQAQHEVRGYPYPSGKIQWKSCPDDLNKVAALDVECGTLAVPLDYSNPNSTETLDLSLIKIPAVSKKPAGHSILFNLGGPGLEVRYSLAGMADLFQAVTGGEHDLIGWDPRGTAETLTYSCYANVTGRLDVSSQLPLGNASDVARGLLWAGGKNYADACADYPEALERGPLIDSSFTARDAMKIVDAVEEDGLLRYYGLSYGTALGAEIVALFPDRVEKVLLDGVVNPTEYFYEMTLAAGTLSSDATFSEFFRQCVSTPKYCSLAQHHPDKAAEQLEAEAYALIDELKYRPFAYNGLVLGYTELKATIRFALYAPVLWLVLEEVFDALLAQPRNETLAGEALTRFLAADSITAAIPVDDAAIGIACVDKTPRSDSFDVVSAVLDQAASVSRLLGDSIAALYSVCAQWKVEPRSRYTGGFEGVKPRKPLLVIGNTYDPATSIISARNVTDTIKPSVLLEHGGVGHASIQHPSLCTAKAIQAYFRNGTLPKPGTLCEPIAPAFQFAVDGPTWQDLFPQLGFDPSHKKGLTSRRENRRGSVEDAAIRIGRHQIGAFL